MDAGDRRWGSLERRCGLELWGVFSYCGHGNRGRFRGLEADGFVGPVAERLIGGVAATAQRDGSFPAEVPFIAIAINQLEGAFHAKGTIKADRNLDFVFRHRLLLWVVGRV
jgi:hypothetical protein